jgi:hypothetical protein
MDTKPKALGWWYILDRYLSVHYLHSDDWSVLLIARVLPLMMGFFRWVVLRSSCHQSGPSSVGGHASKQARGSTPMGPPFAASYPARLFNTAEVLALARSAGLDVLQPAY